MRSDKTQRTEIERKANLFWRIRDKIMPLRQESYLKSAVYIDGEGVVLDGQKGKDKVEAADKKNKSKEIDIKKREKKSTKI